MEVFLYILAFFMMLVGLATVIRAAVYHICCGNHRPRSFLLVCLKSDCELLIRDLVEQMKYLGLKSAIAVDMGMDAEELRGAQMLCEDFNIPLIRKENLIDYISKR